MPEADIELAFANLISLLEAELREVNSRGENAFRTREYERARRLVEDGKRLEQLLKDLRALRARWQGKNPVRARRRPKTRARAHPETGKKHSHLAPGLRTRTERYRPEILTVLADMGGSGSTKAVREALERRLGSTLNEFDRARLPSGMSLRWWNAAMWCRREMVQDGLLSGTSPRAVWELTDAGWRAAKALGSGSEGAQ